MQDSRATIVGMTMFADLRPRPPDAILGLMERYRADDRPGKVSLASGVYVDESGTTPVLATVREAEARILRAQVTKVYKPIDGDPAYLGPVRELVFGPRHPAVAAGRVELLHTPGGTGALRVAADLVHALRPGTGVWLPTPTWPNHPQVFEAAGLPVRDYPYLGPDGALDLGAVVAALRAVPAGDVVVLHGCCHNPTGIDPTPAGWSAISAALAEAGALPLLDFAYQGFADGLREDARGLDALLEPGGTMLVASSFSKSFALYDERVGALAIVGSDATETQTLLSHAKAAVRANYSNPPAHGGEIVATILGDDELRERWKDEVGTMRDRINGNRRLFVSGLEAAGAPGDHQGLLRQRGMFSLLPLGTERVARLRDEFAIYVVGSGRVNVAGLTQASLGRVCEAIASVTS
jgi:aspartate/tyrosine/aromatic aminotransferase